MRLSPTSYVVLGTIALRGPSTSYDLKRAVGHSIGYFWSFPHAQLYSEPKRLAGAGLLSQKTEQGGRRRTTYRLTAAGRAALRAWLSEPTETHFEMRDIAELKLFFSEVGGQADVARLAAGQIASHRGRIAVYEDMQARFSGQPEIASRMRTLVLGLEMERASLRFWESVAAHPSPSLEPLAGRGREEYRPKQNVVAARAPSPSLAGRRAGRRTS